MTIELIWCWPVVRSTGEPTGAGGICGDAGPLDAQRRTDPGFPPLQRRTRWFCALGRGGDAGPDAAERHPSSAALGWLLASGSSSDAHHIVAPEPQGLQASRAIDDALRRAGISPADLCAVQAHATGTSLGDLAEARALRRSLGSAADHLPVCAPKGQLGHLLGGAGAVETILALQSLRDGLVPKAAMPARWIWRWTWRSRRTVQLLSARNPIQGFLC